MKTLVMLVASALFISLTQPATAQNSPWQVEARVGVALPLDELADVELEPGASLTATVSYRFTDAIAVYGGWGWHLFAADEVAVTPDGAVEETGYVLGLAYNNTLGSTGYDYRVHAGLTYEHIEIEDDDGDVIEDTDHGVGFELGTAWVVPINSRLSVSPGLRYRHLSRDVELGGESSSAELTSVSAEVGIGWRF